jgi:diaminohydroxyphosphoribosylaminopyrimidine deaminase/5-amino-6-(5-phosphoribosylamino)uracil reductase
MASGESQWITGPAARADVQRLRAASGAVVTGVGTVLADDCSLTVREPEFAGTVGEAALNGRQPLRVVLDSELRTPPAAKVLRGGGETLLLHREGLAVDAPIDGVTLAALPASPAGGLDLPEMLKLLAAREVNEILVESGPRLVGALLAAGLLDELIVYQAPCLLGSAGRPLVDLPLERMADRVPLALADRRRVGDDWRLTFTVTQDH